MKLYRIPGRLPGIPKGNTRPIGDKPHTNSGVIGTISKRYIWNFEIDI